MWIHGVESKLRHSSCISGPWNGQYKNTGGLKPVLQYQIRLTRSIYSRYPQNSRCENAYYSDGVKFKVSIPTVIQTQNSQFHEMLGPQFSRDKLSIYRIRETEETSYH